MNLNVKLINKAKIVHLSMVMNLTLMNSHNLNYLKLYLFVQFNDKKFHDMKLKVCVNCVKCVMLCKIKNVLIV